ncbi:glycerophosphoryl diester phosphodiesterase membrane domain-containing protein [Actinomyces minihominis]|uniref:glycerophosphoryl diester phosphodiesterase membrane domain-containing protein n=1 Tax=Actinomyces minihominis TaxID=2002838 RepID=UPI000C068433|nr:glycerophosphoryl diester phosphodiesterase membrane domain-containing protein [Actinomyces minihominis]
MSSYPTAPWPFDPQNQGWGGPQTPPPPVIPFHPLTLGNLFDGTFAAIRSNPKVMFTVALGVSGVLGLISGLIAAVLPVQDLTIGDGVTYEYEAGFDTMVPVFAGMSVQGIAGIISAAAIVLVTGMLVLSVTNAVVGVNLDLRATWEAVKPHIWRLIGTALLVWLIILALVALTIALPVTILVVGIASGTENFGMITLVMALLILVGIVLIVWINIRLYFAPVATVVEGASPTVAISRSWKLSHAAFWRMFGRVLLMGIIQSIVVGLLSGTLSMLVVLGGSVIPWSISVFLLTLLTSLVTGLAMPFVASYTSLMYVDERMRKEDLGASLQAALDAQRASGATA